MKGRGHKIKLSTPKSAEQKRREDEVASRRAAVQRMFVSEQQPEQHALRLDLPPGVYRCDVCGTTGEALRRAGMGDAFFASKRWCGGQKSAIELCHADLGRFGRLVRDESGGG